MLANINHGNKKRKLNDTKAFINIYMSGMQCRIQKKCMVQQT